MYGSNPPRTEQSLIDISRNPIEPSKMTFDNRSELLAFLSQASHQLKTLLSYHDNEEEQSNIICPDNDRIVNNYLKLEKDLGNFYECSKTLHFVNDIDVPQNLYLQQTSNDCSSRAVTSGRGYNNYDNNELHQIKTTSSLENQVGYATHNNVPSSASTNFVNITQYSAKPSQRQDTGYAYRDETALVQPATNIPSQEYQPECAYCNWLAATSLNSFSSVPQMEPTTSVSIEHYNTINYTYNPNRA